MSIEYYDKQGNPLTHDEYFALLETIGPDYKRVALTKVGEITVSTVWLGMNHQLGYGEPLIFESMVFGWGDKELMERYSTLEEAEEGHKALVAEVKGEANV